MKNQIIKNDLKEIAANNIVPWQKLEGTTILITGGNGMIGSYIVETILYLNHHVFAKKAKVVCLARNKEKTLNRFENYKNREDLEFIFQDICDPINFNENVDYIIHAASQASPKYYGIDPVGTLEANTLGTRNALQLAKQKNIKSFLFISSGEVYGIINSANPIDETDYGYLDPTNIRSCYAESKRLGETMCVSYAKQYNIPAKIIRPFHTYGPTMDLNDGRVFADFVKNIIKNNNIELHSDGSAKRSFCYITDGIIGTFLILLKGVDMEAYNLSNPFQEISMKNLAEILVSLVHEKQLKVVFKQDIKNGYLPSRVNRTLPNINKIQSLGWSPKITIEEGFKRVIDALS